ncbi:MAG: hypothetical protein J2P41_01310 [Blastocatellia bacterium]|nr:hypothetical protein [Blastocatellia bacterium]
MAAQSTKLEIESINEEEVRQTLERVLNSKYFVNAHKKRQFLSVVCDFYIKDRARELNEYILAYDVFSRDSGYNPSADPIVRVVAHEIRKKLESYYQNEGADDEIRMELPAGSYQPVFHRRQLPVVEEINKSEEKIASVPDRRNMNLVILGLVCLTLAVAVIVLALSNLALRRKTDAPKEVASYGKFWGSFLTDSTPTVVVLSNPPVPRLSNAYEPEILLKDSIPLSADTIKALRKKLIPNPRTLTGGSEVKQYNPRLIISNQNHTGIGEAIGLHYLTNFFHNLNREISLKQSRTLSAEDLKNRNVIMLGGDWVNDWSGKLPSNEDFTYSMNATILNRKPLVGEEHEYVPEFDRSTGGLLTDYAIITVKPNLTAANNVMVLSGIYSQGTEATVEFITGKDHLDQIDQRIGNMPAHFQALLKVGVENGIPTTITLLAFHKLQ